MKINSKQYYGLMFYGVGIAALATNELLMFGYKLNSFWQTVVGTVLMGIGAMIIAKEPKNV